MSKKSDDSIERIFRQALTQYDTTFQTNDWLKMEKMLDEEAARRTAARSLRNKGIAFTLLGLTGLIIAVYFLAFNNPSESIGRLNDSSKGTQAEGSFSENENVPERSSSDGLLSKSADADSTASKNDINKDGSDAESGLTSSSSKNELKQREAIRSTVRTKSLAEEKNTIINASGSPLKNIPLENDIERTPDANSLSSRTPDISDGTRIPSSQGEKFFEVKDSSIAEDGSSEKNADGIISNNDQQTDLNEDPLLSNNFGQRKSVMGGSSPGEDVVGQVDKPGQDVAHGETISNEELPKGASENIDILAKTENKTTADEIVAPVESLSGDPIALNHQTNSDSVEYEFDRMEQNRKDSLKRLATENEETYLKSRGGRWSAGVMLAPEFSSTSLDQYSTPGESIGLRIGYRISKRLFVTTGFIRSNKKYAGEGDAYKPNNPAYWQYRTNGMIPEKIASKCLVYELPIGIQADVIQARKSRVFISGTMSSYFMKNQHYEYEFNSPNPGADMSWSTSKSESYWFNVAGISAGYERYIYSALAIGIEPYLKVPLSEIGWPNVKLFSTGAYVTIRYRF